MNDKQIPGNVSERARSEARKERRAAEQGKALGYTLRKTARNLILPSRQVRKQTEHSAAPKAARKDTMDFPEEQNTG